jgi:cysteine-rich repeat protein
MQSIRLLGLAVGCAMLAAIGCASQPASRVCANGIVCPDGTTCAAVQAVCIVGNCGNGLVDPGEQCDDGNITEGDGCSANCRIEVCGNGIVDPGEVCDDGNTVDGDGCAHDCKSTEVCGNGIKDIHEACDDGNTKDGDGCSANCKSTEICGNGIVDTAVGEVCDDGGTHSGHCSPDCRSGLGCGNGIVDPGEECDDGNNVNTDDCRNDCVVNRCGDGFVDTVAAHPQACDGAPQAGVGVKTVTPTETATCNVDCSPAACGDGKLNRTFKPDGVHAEQCDNGGANNDAADCTAGCQVNVCGDGKVNTTGVNKEDCDHGANNGKPGDTCSTTCHLVSCGNGVVEQGEECDDGAGNGDTKRCTSHCKFNVCGDGLTFAGVEQCDDGVNGVRKDTAACDDDCTFAVCGDGHKNTVALEACDDGANNGKPGDTCSLTCKLVSCGNGTVEQGEECDDGAANNGPGKRCNAGCKLNVCGDGNTLTGVEQCDDGAGGTKKDSTTCDQDCTFAVCGDGYLNTLAGEQCDHGANNGKVGDTCDSFCKLVACGNGLVDTGEQCDPGTGTPATDSATCDSDCTAVFCGDGHRNTVTEMCDDGNDNGNPCAYGDPTCSRCNKTCTATTQPGGPYCGDSVINGPEVCDQGKAVNGSLCTYGDFGCLSGTDLLKRICNNTCAGFITSSVAAPNGLFCGDGLVQTVYNEHCDPNTGLHDLAAPLATQGVYDAATCNFDCTRPLCGDGYANAKAGETCDDGNTNVCGTCSADCSTKTQAAAGGTITTPSANLMTTGDVFTLDDGFHSPTTFEYCVKTATVTTCTAGGGHVLIATDIADAADVVRDLTVAAISGVGATLDINAAAGGAGVAVLTNTHQSALGNKPITATTVTNQFLVTGMSGGLAGDCPVGVGCASNADCASNSCNLVTRRCQ